MTDLTLCQLHDEMIAAGEALERLFIDGCPRAEYTAALERAHSTRDAYITALREMNDELFAVIAPACGAMADRLDQPIESIADPTEAEITREFSALPMTEDDIAEFLSRD